MAKKFEDTQFKAGTSGNPNGRPKGSKHKLGEAFLSALHENFEEHGAETIEQVRVEKPDQYLKVVASIIPKDINLTVGDEMTESEMLERLKELNGFISIALRNGADNDKPESDTKH